MVIKSMIRKCGLIFVGLIPIFLLSEQKVELITTFEGETEMGVSIKTSHPIIFEESVSQSPPILKLLFPGMEFTQTTYSKQISLPPLYKLEARMVGTKKFSTEVTLYFTTLPDYHIQTEDGLITRISWIPEREAMERRRTARRISTVKTTVTLHFKVAEISDIMRLLQVQNNLNIVAGGNVEGKVTV